MSIRTTGYNTWREKASQHRSAVSGRIQFLGLNDPLLKYAEALRTGKKLHSAKRLRPALVAAHPLLIEALEEEMPFSVLELPARPPREPRPPQNERRPTPKQRRELARLAAFLGRPVPTCEDRGAARAQIFHWRQVCKTLGKRVA